MADNTTTFVKETVINLRDIVEIVTSDGSSTYIVGAIDEHPDGIRSEIRLDVMYQPSIRILIRKDSLNQRPSARDKAEEARRAR